MKITTILSIALTVALSSTLQATEFKEHPGLNQLGSIEKMQKIPGGSFMWLKVDGENYLVSENGRVAIKGNFTVMDVWSKTKISNIEEAHKLNRLHIDKINLKLTDLPTIVMGQGNKEVTVFVDPNCTKCKDIYKQLPDLIDSYKINLVVTPVLNKESVKHSRQLNCLIKSGQQKKAFDALVQKNYSEFSDIKCDSDAVKKAFLSARVMGIRSVPFIIAPNGETLKKANIDLLEFIKTNEI